MPSKSRVMADFEKIAPSSKESEDTPDYVVCPHED